MYHVFGEKFIVTEQRTIFNDTMLRMLESISLEPHSKMSLLGASKATIVRSDAVGHGSRGHSC